MRKADFSRLVRAKYINDPFGVSGIAFWKVQEQIIKADTFQVDTPQAGICLYAVVNQKLVFYWSENEEPFIIPEQELKDFRLLSLHSRFEGAVTNLEDTHTINTYSPLNYEGDPSRDEKGNDNIQIVTIDKQNRENFADIANIINEHTGGRFTPEFIESWTALSVYTPDLWIGAIDKRTSDLVGVGISTYNPAVMETDLDWFYVRKNHQGCGVGRMLVRETISRCRKKSGIIRVAGQADEFYEKCGFVRKDRWYYLTKKSAKVEWWD